MRGSTTPTVFTAAILACGFLVMGPGNASAATIFYGNEADWLTAVNTGGLSASSFDTTASNMALADQVAAAPGNGTNMGTTLTFTGANTGFGFDFEVSAPLGGPFLASLSYAGTAVEGAFSPGASNGNDNFKVTLSGDESVFGYAFTITGNASGVDTSTNVEGFFLGAGSAPLPLTSGGAPSVFLGVISDDVITVVIADESQTDGDLGVLYSDLRFATATIVPEPSTGLLLSMGLIAMTASRRCSRARAA